MRSVFDELAVWAFKLLTACFVIFMVMVIIADGPKEVLNAAESVYRRIVTRPGR